VPARIYPATELEPSSKSTLHAPALPPISPLCFNLKVPFLDRFRRSGKSGLYVRRIPVFLHHPAEAVL